MDEAIFNYLVQTTYISSGAESALTQSGSYTVGLQSLNKLELVARD